MLNEIAKAFYNRYMMPRFPLGLTIYLTNRCNLRCAFCEIGLDNLSGAGRARALRELSRDEIDRCIDLCRKADIKRLYVTGGEPLLEKNLWYLLARCRENHLVVDDITTNGTLLDRLDSQQIELINEVVRDIIISIDSADPEEHDQSRGTPGTFKKIEEFFLHDKKKRLFKTGFSFNTVVHNGNFSNLKGIIDLGRKWAVRHINFQPVCTDTIFPDMDSVVSKQTFTQDLNLAVYKESIEELSRYAEERNISTNLSVFKVWTPFYFTYLNSEECFIRHLPGKFICSKVYNYIHINYNGDLIPCANLEPFANINEKDFFLSWQNHGQKLKSIFSDGNYFSQCRSCFCDFPANFRFSLLYFPLANFKLLVSLRKYYLSRAKTF